MFNLQTQINWLMHWSQGKMCESHSEEETKHFPEVDAEMDLSRRGGR